MLGRIYNQRAQCFEKLKRCAPQYTSALFEELGSEFLCELSLGVAGGRRLFMIMIAQSTLSPQAEAVPRCMRTGPRSSICLVRGSCCVPMLVLVSLSVLGRTDLV